MSKKPVISVNFEPYYVIFLYVVIHISGLCILNTSMYNIFVYNVVFIKYIKNCKLYFLSLICESYACKFDILFNCSKIECLYLKEMSSNDMPSGIIVYQVVCDRNLSEKALHFHFCHIISSDNRDCITFAAKSNFWKSYNILL